ncbi:hypothetical protein BSK65_26825 [Paenibacillus odorifer]|uniref:Uncharacterized protein n=1 Tax=Paenibacillus odorifer TaxID=189426 RepID=A0A1R0Z950_9BACL|nr:hypothetical protein [Paenibacillus odorifer]OMD46318.1 hypothetical protein BSK51_27165 [Paenibacillus odorifer]OME64763.1 hypothetical protein BSK65_26825 [Paenibacillus odorifer]
MQRARKERFKDEVPITDGYTNQTLERDGQSHIEHVISAKELHDDDWLRLYLDVDERKDLANSDNNKTWTNASLNKSKQDQDLIKWMETPSTNDETKTNAQYYKVDKEQAKELYSQARRERNKRLYNKVGKEVMVQCERFAEQKEETIH